jgi:hypothetical protein
VPPQKVFPRRRPQSSQSPRHWVPSWCDRSRFRGGARRALDNRHEAIIRDEVARRCVGEGAAEFYAKTNL